MTLFALFRAVRITLLAVVFALLLGECVAPGLTSRLFKSGPDSSQQSPRKPGGPSATLRA